MFISPSFTFGLFIVVSAYNGLSLIYILILILLWFILTKGTEFKMILLCVTLLGYLAIVHAIKLPNELTACAKVITHYDSGGVMEIKQQRFRTFEPIDRHVSSLCATFTMKDNDHYLRLSLDPLTRAQQASRQMGTITFKKLIETKTHAIEVLKKDIRDFIFPERDDDMFWMIHHSGLWISSFISILASTLNLFLKKEKVNLLIHVMLVCFSWLMWDQRTCRLLLLSCARLLKFPHQKAQGLSFIVLILMFPYSIISLSFLFPFIIFILKSCHFKSFDQWLILIAFQQTMFASWSMILLFSYSFIGQLLWFSHMIQRFFPQFQILHFISRNLNDIHKLFQVPGGFNSGTFFACLGCLALTQRFKLLRQISVIFLILWMIQPLRWLPQVHFINVGQGHATLIKYKHHQVLIDTGKQRHSFYLKHYLHYYHVKNLNALLITHDDEDHSGGVKTLFEEHFISTVFPHKTSWSSPYWSISSLLEQRYDESNEDSGIYLVQLPKLKLLITGDAYHEQEKQLMNMYHDLKVDVLLAGHHGSKTSTHPDFLSHIDPKLVIISAQSSIYGHPHQETLRTLHKQQVLSYQIEKEGDIILYCFPWFNLVLSSGGGFAIMR
jgi:competence protein ComEC